MQEQGDEGCQGAPLDEGLVSCHNNSAKQVRVRVSARVSRVRVTRVRVRVGVAQTHLLPLHQIAHLRSGVARP